MALTPELAKLKAKLEGVAVNRRTPSQSQLLDELEALDGQLGLENLSESLRGSVTKMTSPGGGGCPCCGQ